MIYVSSALLLFPFVYISDQTFIYFNDATLFKSENDHVGFSYKLTQTSTEYCVRDDVFKIQSCFPDPLKTIYSKDMSDRHVSFNANITGNSFIPKRESIQANKIPIDSYENVTFFQRRIFYRVYDIVQCVVSIPFFDFCIYHQNVKKDLDGITFENNLEQFPKNEYPDEWGRTLRFFVSNRNRNKQIYSKGFNVYLTYDEIDLIDMIEDNIIRLLLKI